MSCQAQVGLLILRPCGQPPVGNCLSCGIPLCEAHVGTGTCPDCLVAGGHGEESDLAREAANRHQYYEAYGKRTEFGGAGYFSAADRASLAAGGVLGAGALGAGALARRQEYDHLDT
jgi:hypothetical protein